MHNEGVPIEHYPDFSRRRGYEAPRTIAAPVHTSQVNQVISDSPSTHNFRGQGCDYVNVKKRTVSADALSFIPNYLLRVDLFNSKRTAEG